MAAVSADDDLQCVLLPGDASSAERAGAEFARALAGAPSAAFAWALDEQQDLVRQAVRRAGFSLSTARRSAESFCHGAQAEWARLAAQVSAPAGCA